MEKNIDLTGMPERVIEFLRYMQYNKKKSVNTVDAYQKDLRMFFKYLRFKKEFSKQMKIDDISNIDISEIDDEFINKISISDLNSFISYVAIERGNQEKAQARKIASIKSFYEYMYKNDIIEKNVAVKLENVKIPEREPIYLTLDETKKLVSTVRTKENRYQKRDYAIISVFLNCAVRLSELVGIDLDSINFEYNKLTVIGKGNKQRTVPMNPSVIESLKEYLKFRQTIEDRIKDEDKKALFISSNKRRIGQRSIEQIIKQYIVDAGLDPNKYTPHKLRHTAATLMFKYGKVDIRTLQKILGHSSPNTTQIYTHVDDEQMQDAVNSMPVF
jgi:site-specific recombinase XerD